MPHETIADVDRILRERWDEVMAGDPPADGDPSAICLFTPNRGRYYYLIVESTDADPGGWYAWRIDRQRAGEPHKRKEDYEFVGHRPTSGQAAVLVVTLMEEQP